MLLSIWDCITKVTKKGRFHCSNIGSADSVKLCCYILQEGILFISVAPVSLDPCSRYPCQNGGTCSRKDSTSFTCTCAVGFKGLYCESKAITGKSFHVLFNSQSIMITVSCHFTWNQFVMWNDVGSTHQKQNTVASVFKYVNIYILVTCMCIFIYTYTS